LIELEGTRVSETESREQGDPWQSVPNQGGPPGPPGGSQGTGLPGAAPGYGNGYGYGYGPAAPGYGYPQGGPQVPPNYYPGYARKTNGLAVASMVCGICGFLYIVPAILGIVFGSIALRQIRRDGTDGRGMAIAGIVTGSLWVALLALIVILVIAASH
jgi:hypothetical protein